MGLLRRTAWSTASDHLAESLRLFLSGISATWFPRKADDNNLAKRTVMLVMFSIIAIMQRKEPHVKLDRRFLLQEGRDRIQQLVISGQLRTTGARAPRITVDQIANLIRQTIAEQSGKGPGKLAYIVTWLIQLSDIAAIVRKVVTKAGVVGAENITAYSYRKAVMASVRRKHSLNSAKEFAGHSSIWMSKRYTGRDLRHIDPHSAEIEAAPEFPSSPGHSSIQDLIDWLRPMVRRTTECAEKIRECPVCGIRISRSSLRRHLFGHKKIEERAHVCEVCDKPFTAEVFLKEHMVVHREDVSVARREKEFECPNPDCSSTFTRKNAMTQHIARFHTRR